MNTPKPCKRIHLENANKLWAQVGPILRQQHLLEQRAFTTRDPDLMPLVNAVRELRKVYSEIDEDPCRAHRAGSTCERCPYNPVCNE